MTNNELNARETQLRQIFRHMDGNAAQEIRQAYYNAVEGLRTLADALEIADANQPEPAGKLINEHLIACEALEAMKRSLLGRIL